MTMDRGQERHLEMAILVEEDAVRVQVGDAVTSMEQFERIAGPKIQSI